MRQNNDSKNSARKYWRCFAILWPLLCFVFVRIIITQSGRTTDEKISDTIFTIIPLIFFAIGMSIRRRLIKERENATAYTTAIVISEGKRKRTGKNKSYFPEFAFQANGVNYKVISPVGVGFSFVKKGEQVDLYYMPENPRLFYVPVLQKYDKRCSRLFCGIGVLFPLAGLFAPQLRLLLS